MLVGVLRDQAEIDVVLHRVSDLGLTLLSASTSGRRPQALNHRTSAPIPAARGAG